MNRRHALTFLAFAISTILPISGFAQTGPRTQVDIRITDQTDAQVPGASLFVLTPLSVKPESFVFEGVSSTAGTFSLRLTPGRYRMLTIEPGFPMDRRELEVTSAAQQLHIVLRFGGYSGPVVVSDPPPAPNLVLDIRDGLGATLPNATITFFKTDPLVVYSDQAGNASATLPPGIYKVVVQSPNFRTVIQEIKAGNQPSTVHIALSPR